MGNEPGRRIRYYVQGVEGGRPRAITPENVSFNTEDPVAISPDGRSVAGLDGKLVLYPLDDGAPRALPNLKEDFAPLRWCPDNSLLVYHAGDVPVKILRVDVAKGEQTLWKEFAPSYRTGLLGIASIRVSADCRSSGYSAGYVPSELWIADACAKALAVARGLLCHFHDGERRLEHMCRSALLARRRVFRMFPGRQDTGPPAWCARATHPGDTG